MSTTHPVGCFLIKTDGSEPLPVSRLMLHHEVQRLPQAWVLVQSGVIKIGDGPYQINLQDEAQDIDIMALGETVWYVNEVTQLLSPANQGQAQWLLRLGVIKSQNNPMAALLAEGQTAAQLLTELCVNRENMQVQWVSKPYANRLGTVMSLGETLEGFLRRFAKSINSWFVCSGEAQLCWSTQDLASLDNTEQPHTIAVAAVTKAAAPTEVRQLWAMSLAKLKHGSVAGKASSVRRTHEVVQTTEAEVAQVQEQWTRAGEWVLHYGLSDEFKHFGVHAGQAVGQRDRVALAVIHVWRTRYEDEAGAGGGRYDNMQAVFDGLIGGLLPEQLTHFLSSGTNYAVLSLSVDQAGSLSQHEGALLLEQCNLRTIARTLGKRLYLGSHSQEPPAPSLAAGPMPATVMDMHGAYTPGSQDDYAALPAVESAENAPEQRSMRVKIRFDWHNQVLEVPYAAPWAGAGGAVFFPPRAGDRVLVQFMAGDWSAPVVCASLMSEYEATAKGFRPAGEAWHARQPQGISARDGLMLETTESGDLVLYAKKGNLVLRARDTVLLQGRVLDRRFTRDLNSGRQYELEGEDE